jgi:hypothetical protein
MEEQVTQSPPATQNKDTQHPQQNLPNSTTVLILGILSIVFSIWYFSIIGVILSILTLVISGRDIALYHSDTSRYTLNSYHNLKAGRICAFIGLIIAIVFVLITVLIIFGTLATMPFWGIID